MNEETSGRGAKRGKMHLFHLAALQHLPTRRGASRVAGLCRETAEGGYGRGQDESRRFSAGVSSATRLAHVRGVEKPGTNIRLRVSVCVSARPRQGANTEVLRQRLASCSFGKGNAVNFPRQGLQIFFTTGLLARLVGSLHRSVQQAS